MALGLCRFTNADGGLVDWTYPGPTIDMQSPASAGAVDGTVYEYYAQSLDMSQWEIGTGAYTAATGVFARTTVIANSNGDTAKINFLNPPQIVVYDLSANSAVLYAAQTLTAPQQAQARTNIGAAASPSVWTRTVLTTASTSPYARPAGCKAILVREVGGGAGSSGSGSSGGTAGGAGTASTFNAGAITAPGGFPSTALSAQGGAGGAAGIGGDFSIPGAAGQNGDASIALGDAGSGGSSFFGGAGRGARPSTADNTAGAAQSGSGGGGASSASGVGAVGGGGAGAYTEKLITSPASSYTFVVGVGGAAGTAGAGGVAGAAGGSGMIIVEEYY